MIIQLHFDVETQEKLWHITQASSQHLGKEYNLADVCMSIILAYIKERYIILGRDDD